MTAINTIRFSPVAASTQPALRDRESTVESGVETSGPSLSPMNFARLLNQSPISMAKSLQHHAADASQMFESPGEKGPDTQPNGNSANRARPSDEHQIELHPHRQSRPSPAGHEQKRPATASPKTWQPQVSSASDKHVTNGASPEIDRLAPGHGNHGGQQRPGGLVVGQAPDASMSAPGTATAAPLAVSAPIDVSSGSVASAQRVGEFLAQPRGVSTNPSPTATSVPASAANAGTFKPKSTVLSRMSEQRPATGSGETPDHSAPEKARFDDVLRSIRMHSGAKRSTARLRLEPPELGRIRVDVRIVGETVSVDVQAETEAARMRLAERAAELKSGLAEHGIHVERFEVFVDHVGRGDLAGWSTRDWSGSAGGRPAATRIPVASRTGPAKDQGLESRVERSMPFELYGLDLQV